ncbi:YHS domain-containing (seleno)protein [Tropicimonas sediminicola]|uniref:YHS domain-containing protein n=1 Tax=Tropicimonas sediminicola TaxID=1031541 RepID=A0A239HZW4_9RHOB|nr:YHS domain-containing (seleno)protein [Tropicimonas sediminicola]SNS87066.1 YHS domain-containing protein [Tropicimonas sediminicola]
MITRRALLELSVLSPMAYALTSGVALAMEPEIFQNPIAINGTDPVGYFTDREPVPGSSANRVMWKGAAWHFASPENAAAFEANPTKYAPVFGGYCAFAASRGYLAPTIPEAWTIHEGKLYLNATLRARELWLQDVPGNIAAGLKNWPGILG